MPISQSNLRNIAIIAHVDHGKTTLVDALLKQTKTFADHQAENQQTTIMDSNELERERGVTILSKNTSVFWENSKTNEKYKINILDTPGHSDFSGEVERVLNMADGCLLLVDASEGVLSQTKYVLSLALGLGLKPIVVINKVDRKDQRIKEVENEIGDLFLELAQNDDQLDFKTIYARGIEGIAGFKTEPNDDNSLKITDSEDLTPLLETIVEDIPAPTGNENKPLQFQVNTLDWDDHKGKIMIGKIFQGKITKGEKIALLQNDQEGNELPAKFFNITYVFVQHGLNRLEVESAGAGEIVALAGIDIPKIGDTVSDPKHPERLTSLQISEPTVKIEMSVNTSPFVGKEAKFSTSNQLKKRLQKEIETNVGLRLLPGTGGESMTLVGRGELHLAILIETMRRESYEFSLSRPQVVLKEIDGQTHEPWEKVVIDVPTSHTGTITANMSKRQGKLSDMTQTKQGVRFIYEISTATLIGYRNELITSTSGEGVLNSNFLEFRPKEEHDLYTRGGAVIAHQTGTVAAYSVEKAQQRAKLIVNPGEDVYAGQVVGINSRSDDMVMNLVRGKKLTNMRASGSDDTVSLTPAWKPTLEQFLTLIEKDEMLEVTPENLRLRKRDLVKAVKR